MTNAELKALGISPKKCMFILVDDFNKLLKKADILAEASVELDGISYYNDGEDWSDDEVNLALGKFLGIEITSIHADDCEYPGIWIAYR